MAVTVSERDVHSMNLTALLNLPGFFGRQALRLPDYLFSLTLFMLRALQDWRVGRRTFNHASHRTLIGQIIFSGVDALPITTLLALATGLALTTQTILTIQVIGERADVIDILIRLVVLELSTLLTAFILIGRSGSAICVDLGNMKLHRELEGLQMLGINLNHFLVTPRLIGMALSQMVLAVYFAALAIIGGVLFLGTTHHSGYMSYLADVAAAFAPYDLLIFMGKNLFFGLLIGGISCFHGLRVSQSITEVPQQTQRAIVNSMSIVFILNTLFTILVH